MNYKTTAALVTVLLIVSAYVFFVERNMQIPSQRDQRLARQNTQEENGLFAKDPLPVATIDQITIQRTRGDKTSTVILAKEGGDWWQTVPVRFPVSTWSADRLIEDAAGLRYHQRFTPGKVETPTLDDAKLSPPQVVITFQTTLTPTSADSTRNTGATELQPKPSDRGRTLRLGRLMLGGRGYATVDASPDLYVIDDVLHQVFEKESVTDWRKKTLGIPGETQAHRVMLEYPGHKISMRKVDGQWQLDEPHFGRVAASAVGELLKSAGQATTQEFVNDAPQNLTGYGLDPQITPLTLELTILTTPPDSRSISSEQAEAKASQPNTETIAHTLRVGGETDMQGEQYFASWWQGSKTDVNVVMTLLKSDVEPLLLSVDELRDPSVTAAQPGDVRALTVDRVINVGLRDQPKFDQIRHKLQLLREPEGWSLDSTVRSQTTSTGLGPSSGPGPMMEMDSGLVAGLVESITDCQAQSYYSKPAPQAVPLAEVTLAMIGRTEPEVLRVYADDQPDSLLVYRHDEKVGYRVLFERLAGLFEPLITLRDRTVLALSLDQIVRMELTRADGTTYVWVRDGDRPSIRGNSSGDQPATQPVALPPEGRPWRLVGHDKFEEEALDRLLAYLSPLSAEHWIAHQAQAPPLKASEILTVQTTEGVSHTIRFDTTHAIAWLNDQAQQGTRFQVSSGLVKLLTSELRHRTVLPLTVAEIDQVILTGAHGSMTIARNADGQYVDMVGHGVDQSAAAALYDTLAGLRVHRFVADPSVLTIQPQPTSEDDQRLTLDIRTKDGRSFSLVLPKLPGHETTATLGDQWFTLSPEIIQKLQTIVPR